MKLRELAAWVGGTVVGDPNREISRVSEPEQAMSDSIVLAGDARALTAVEAGEAAAVLIPEGLAPARKPAIRARNVRLAFAKLLERFAPPPDYPEGVHPTAVVGIQVVLGDGVSLGPHVSIAQGARIGTGTVILAGAAIGRAVIIGEQCIIHANATIREHCQLGNRVIIHAGAVIGSDGFGYAEGEDFPVKIPHLGRVVIEDDVEIGANTTIDRATLGETRVGRGTKIDNLVQVAHNVRIGRGVIIVGQVGISGSVSIGDGAVLAGQAGVPDHVNVGARARLLARAVPTKDVSPGATLSGFPARAHREELRQQAVLRRLPEMLDRLETLENRLLGLEKAQSIMTAPPPREKS